MKVIKSFELDLSPLRATQSIRSFLLKCDRDAVFSLEIKNEDNHYYNFVINSFQAEKAGIYDEIVSEGVFEGEIYFPTITDNDQYDIFLTAQGGTTKHIKPVEVRFDDGSLDINSSTGSNSLLINKVIYQYVDQTLTISPFSFTGGIEVGSVVSDTITLSRGLTAIKQPFSISTTVTTASKCYRVIKQPTSSDLISFIEPVIGSAPITISGENIYPTVTSTAKINVEVDDSTTVTIDGLVGTPTVGDQFKIIDGPNSTSAQIVTAVGESTVTSSVAISAADNKVINFSKQMNYQWPINNFAHIIKEDMLVGVSTNVAASTLVSRYKDSLILFPKTLQQQTIIKNEVEPVRTLAVKPVITRGDISTQAGAVIFNKQQVLVLAGDTLRIGGYGQKSILQVYGYDVVFSNLAIAITPVATTTTAASSNSTSVVVASRNGILDAVSTVSGIGINAALADPTVASGAGAVTGAGTIVLSSAQTIEDGATLNFAGAGQTATITGNIQVFKAGIANQTLRFDVDKLLSIT